jgi:ribitol 2-dehydrogenase
MIVDIAVDAAPSRSSATTVRSTGSAVATTRRLAPGAHKSAEPKDSAGAHVVMVDRDEAALKALCDKHGDAAIPLVIDLLDPKDCATLLPKVLEKAGQLDILHANAGTYVGGDLIDADSGAIDRMLNLNVNVVMKNVHDVLPHMIERRTGDIIITSSLAAHFPTPWEPVYASSKWAINCFVQTVRRQVFKHGIRVGSISPGPVITALLADWPPEKLTEARESGSLLEASEVADVVMFMLTRPRGMTIRDVVMLPTNFRSLGMNGVGTSNKNRLILALAAAIEKTPCYGTGWLRRACGKKGDGACHLQIAKA